MKGCKLSLSLRNEALNYYRDERRNATEDVAYSEGVEGVDALLRLERSGRRQRGGRVLTKVFPNGLLKIILIMDKEIMTTSWEESGMMAYYPITEEESKAMLGGELPEVLTPEEEAEADY